MYNHYTNQDKCYRPKTHIREIKYIAKLFPNEMFNVCQTMHVTEFLKVISKDMYKVNQEHPKLSMFILNVEEKAWNLMVVIKMRWLKSCFFIGAFSVQTFFVIFTFDFWEIYLSVMFLASFFLL